MLRNTMNLEGSGINATDDTISHVNDHDFDDEAWVIRNLVVDTSACLSSRRPLIVQFAAEFPLIGPIRFPGMGTN
jgi:hypothetical protein